MIERDTNPENKEAMQYDTVLGNVKDTLEADRNYTYYEEQMKIQSCFKSIYGFKCKMSLAHEIILAIRKQGYDKRKELFDYYRCKRYGILPAS